MNFETLDDPFADLEEESNESSFKINRYEVSRPHDDELLFKQLKSFNISNVVGFVFFFLLGGFFAFLLIYYIIDEGFEPSMLLVLLFVAGGWVPAGIVYVDKFTSRRQLLFNPVAFFQTNAFGKVRTVDRDSVKSIYIKKTTTVQRNSNSSPVYHYDIKMNTNENPQLDLMSIQIKSALQANTSNRLGLAESDSLRICRLISEQWDIPVQVE